jgi:hypothetical protein
MMDGPVGPRPKISSGSRLLELPVELGLLVMEKFLEGDADPSDVQAAHLVCKTLHAYLLEVSLQTLPVMLHFYIGGCSNYHWRTYGPQKGLGWTLIDDVTVFATVKEIRVNVECFWSTFSVDTRKYYDSKLSCGVNKLVSQARKLSLLVVMVKFHEVPTGDDWIDVLNGLEDGLVEATEEFQGHVLAMFNQYVVFERGDERRMIVHGVTEQVNSKWDWRGSEDIPDIERMDSFLSDCKHYTSLDGGSLSDFSTAEAAMLWRVPCTTRYHERIVLK